MENEKLNKGIEELRSITMTSLEKESVFQNIVQSELPSEPVISPYKVDVFGIPINKTWYVYMSSLLFLFIVLTTSVFAGAERSLPGDAMYGFKTRVVEPINGKLTFSAKEKAMHASSLVGRRLLEAEILAGKDELDYAKEEQINHLLENHTKVFNTALTKIYEENSEEKDEDLALNFEATLNAHVEVLALINADKKDEEIKSKKISKTAIDNVLLVRDVVKKRQVEKGPAGADKNKRQAVQAIIDKTAKDIIAHELSESPKKKRIVENANKKLAKATGLLKEIDDDEKSGKVENIYEKLRDSEVSAKEAEILLKTGIDLGL